MGLEFTFLDDEGWPEEPVVIGVAEHDALSRATETLALRSLKQLLDDYYKDVVVPVSQIGVLIAELDVLESSIQLDCATRLLAGKMRELAQAALATGKPLHAFAD